MRRLLFLPAIALWIAAAVCRAARWLDRQDGTDGTPAVIVACYVALGVYVAFVAWAYITDTQWTLGWRR
jgi:hypothetical protein